MNIQNIVSQFLDISMKFAVAFIPLFIGVYSKESYLITQRKKRKISIWNIFITSVTLTFIVLGFISWGINNYGLALVLSILFIIGAVSDKIIVFIFNGTIANVIFTILAKSRSVIQESILEAIKREHGTDEDNKKEHDKKKD